MRKIITLSFFLILISTISFSTGYDKPKKNHKFRPGFGNNACDEAIGALSIGYSTIDKEKAFIYGGRIEVMKNNYLAFGLGGIGFFDLSHYDKTIQGNVLLTGGYAGFYIEPILFSKLPVYLSFPVLLGGGNIVTESWETNEYQTIIDQGYLIAEPAAELNLNFFENLEISLGSSYKFYSYFLPRKSLLSHDALGNWSYMLSLKLEF